MLTCPNLFLAYQEAASCAQLTHQSQDSLASMDERMVGLMEGGWRRSHFKRIFLVSALSQSEQGCKVWETALWDVFQHCIKMLKTRVGTIFYNQKLLSRALEADRPLDRRHTATYFQTSRC